MAVREGKRRQTRGKMEEMWRAGKEVNVKRRKIGRMTHKILDKMLENEREINANELGKNLMRKIRIISKREIKTIII